MAKLKPVNVQQALVDLADAGNQVKIEHVRWLTPGFSIYKGDDAAFDAELKANNGRATFHRICTKREFYEAVRQGMLFGMGPGGVNTKFPANFRDAEPECVFGNVIEANSGFTLVTITQPDGQVFTGKRNFGKSEAYNKKNGLVGALSRAIISASAAEMADNVMNEELSLV